MTTRRLSTLVALAAASALALAGCAPGQPSATTGPAATGAPTAAADAPRELTYVYFTDGPDEANRLFEGTHGGWRPLADP